MLVLKHAAMPCLYPGDEQGDDQQAEQLEVMLRLVEAHAVGPQRDIGRRWLERNK